MNKHNILPFRIRAAGFVLGMVVLAAIQARAMSWTDQVAWPGKSVSAEAGWPAGALELVNDPLRSDGWNPCFSEWPNDVNRYEFKISDTADANRLIKKLAAIKSPKLRVQLNPGKEARELGFTMVLKEGNGTAVTFAIGNQKRINEWYQRLQVEEPGLRKFGVHRYTETPTALPPTLVLYVGHPAINLKTLQIPANVEVSADSSDHYRKTHQDDPTLKRIDDFVSKHQTNKPANQLKGNPR